MALAFSAGALRHRRAEGLALLWAMAYVGLRDNGGVADSTISLSKLSFKPGHMIVCSIHRITPPSSTFTLASRSPLLSTAYNFAHFGTGRILRRLGRPRQTARVV